MKTMRVMAIAAAAALLTMGGAATAQEVPRREIRAPEKAAELEIAGGYSQGFGNVRSGASLDDTTNAGGGFELGVGYRIDRRWLVGVYGSGMMHSTTGNVPTSTRVYNTGAGVQAQLHFGSLAEADPWIGFGAGWRALVIHPDSGGTDALHGLDLARVRIGLDYHVAEDVAISPVLGTDVSMYLTESGVGRSGFATISSPTPNVFVFGGVLGRFDIGGVRTSERSMARAY